MRLQRLGPAGYLAKRQNKPKALAAIGSTINP
jgi:hypothetical protein